MSNPKQITNLGWMMLIMGKVNCCAALSQSLLGMLAFMGPGFTNGNRLVA